MPRKDGRLLKTLDPFSKMMPYIMEQRSDAQNFSRQVLDTEKVDEYLKEKRKEGRSITYLHLFITVFVRVLALRPQLNRFVVNRRVYARTGIQVSMAIKRSLEDDGEETSVKFSFSGHEDIFAVAEIVDRVIQENIGRGTKNEADDIAARIMSLPAPLIGIAIGFLKRLDMRGWLPNSLIEASPFHTSVFFTYLKSIKLDYIYHHLYNFGTTGIFVSLGRSKKMAFIQKDQVLARTGVEMGFVLDERICDGLYFTNSLQLMKKILDNPVLLEEPLKSIVGDIL